ncbi:murein hydrolase activator EnvC family protein [Tepidanaerobacter syntrophicus]|uniref:Murein DD-endopeptidase MepM and murein hydrolase activator NlpD n=1 Tax=Tepidanaerobacter syntrophicus TaxID=224999 RepID=A0A0U9HG75_9FIRM|nr:peptidoglycan DD-metalloendopeptidase family protein [Tepidanaerobacter syntrophicus]GAQ25774.1 murein DD-endopeptidase MepM and murein hydrolase activator NlpD [Tepidanaerobacter syntrophicus]GLI20142.1 peptidase M23 [Tepidanaerobacter syntrophicus]
MGGKRKQKMLASVLLLAIALTVASPAAFGDINDLKKQQQNINNQIQNIRNSIKQVEDAKKDVSQELTSLEIKLSNAEKELSTVEAKLQETQTKLVNVTEELKQAEAKVAEQKDDLNTRMRALYKTGPVDYIEVILASSSFSDFLTRLDMVKRIIEADKNLLAEFKARQEEVEAKKAELEEQQRIIAQQRRDISSRRATIVAYRGERQRLMTELEKQKAEYERQEDQLLKDSENLRKQILAWESKNKKGFFGTGIFQWPVPSSTNITSEFGWRVHPILKTNRFHEGLDIAASTGSDVVAADDGEVIFAGSYGAYGNTIIVSHGGGISTQYSHLSRILVAEGKKVSKGDKIGLVGSTGWSTGPHLHFGVIKNGEVVNPLDWVK